MSWFIKCFESCIDSGIVLKLVMMVKCMKKKNAAQLMDEWKNNRFSYTCYICETYKLSIKSKFMSSDFVWSRIVFHSFTWNNKTIVFAKRMRTERKKSNNIILIIVLKYDVYVQFYKCAGNECVCFGVKPVQPAYIRTHSWIYIYIHI